MATLRVRRLDANHDMTFGAGRRNFAATAEATAQRARCDLLVVLGEWFLDTTDGVPWVQPEGSTIKPIMGKGRDLRYSASVLKARILNSDGVDSINAFSQKVNSDRALLVEANANTVDGDVINITQVIDF